ncbi:phage distal tail protein [Salininema proteolyticum]|uniref:Phage tail family protein n=1 Tax=Salininema proteolyticum TaxID=1607685 RepID=A0ABV8TUL9_9ACTN
MDPFLELHGPGDTRIGLNEISMRGEGFEAGPGVAGLGMPPVAPQWVEGAGDGASWRGMRALPRDIDIPLHITGTHRGRLDAHLGRLTRLLSGAMELRWITGREWWSLPVYYTGGLDYTYSSDTGATWINTVISLRSPDPWWSYYTTDAISVGRRETATAAAGWGLLDGHSLSGLRLSPSPVSGPMEPHNTGSAPAWSTITVTGPGATLRVSTDAATWFTWNGRLRRGEELVIDTEQATLTDSGGTSRYGQLAAGPRFHPLQPGPNRLLFSFDETTPATGIEIRWRKRAWTVI